MLIDGIILRIAADGPTSAAAGPGFENVLPRGYVLPSYVIHQAGGTQDEDFLGPIDIREDDIQIDCYANTPLGARLAGKAIRALLSPTSRALGDAYTLTDSDTTVVSRVSVEMDAAMPYKDDGASKGLLDRWMLKLHFVSKAT